MTEEQDLPFDEQEPLQIGYMRESEVEKGMHLEDIETGLKEKIPDYYMERNRDQIFMLLNASRDKLDEFFPDEKNKTYENLETRLMIELLALFCKSAEDLGAFIFASEKSKTEEKFGEYLEDYHLTGDGSIEEIYEKFQKNEVEELKEFIQNVLNLPDRKEVQEGDFKDISNEEALKDYDKTYEFFYDRIREIGELYLEYVSFYRAYKHGYRITTGDIESFYKENGQKVIVDSEVHGGKAIIYVDDKTENAIIIDEEEFERLKTLVADSDQLIKLIKDNFRLRDEKGFRRIRIEEN